MNTNKNMTIKELKPQLKKLIEESRRKRGNNKPVNIDLIVSDIKETEQYEKFEGRYFKTSYVIRRMYAMICKYKYSAKLTTGELKDIERSIDIINNN